MSSLQDTPQQALAGWLHQRGGEKAIKKMAGDIGVSMIFIDRMMDPKTTVGEWLSVTLAISVAVYTDGEVVFRLCPKWVAEKAKEGSRRQAAGLAATISMLTDRVGEYQAFERSWLFKLWSLFHG